VTAFILSVTVAGCAYGAGYRHAFIIFRRRVERDIEGHSKRMFIMGAESGAEYARTVGAYPRNP
jgi:hypothetical protein